MARKKKKNKKYVWIVIAVLVAIAAICIIAISKKSKEASAIEIESEKTENIEENEVIGDGEETERTVELTEQEDAEYEEWLAATVIVAISMEYPEFTDIQVYKAENQDVYAFFKVNDELTVIHSEKIDGERSESGTRDISSQTLGFATFDIIDANEVNRDNMTEIEIDELRELISQSMLVSIYSR